MPVVRVEAEVGSEVNGARARARRLLADPAAGVIVVEHRDRLGRMNTELAGAALAAHGLHLVVVDDGEVTDDLVRDMIEVLTSFCARLYGRRPARNRALKAVGCAERDIGPQAVRTAGSVRRWRVSGLRPIAGPFVAAAPAGARVRTRLRVSAQDEAVLRAAGTHLGSLAGGDLAARCAEGRLDAKGRAGSRAAAEAGADGAVVLAVGRGDHPHQRGPGAARRAEPARRGQACRPGSGGSRHGCRSRRAGRRAGRAGTPPGRAARQDAPPAGAEGQAGPGGAATGGRDGVRWCGAARRCCASGATSPRPGSRRRSGGQQWEAARLFLTADFTDRRVRIIPVTCCYA